MPEPSAVESSVEPLRIPRPLFDAMVEHCRKESPLEACGILGGQGSEVRSIYPLRNKLASEKRFSADPRDLIEADRALRASKQVIVAIFHSHPKWDPIPSKTDLELNFHGETPQIIISFQRDEPEVRAWRLHSDSYDELPWKVEET